VIVRRAALGEVDAAVAIWRSAYAASSLRHHPARLRRWSQEPTSRLFVADDEDDLIGMVLSLVARADDGAGPPIPRARHITGLAVRPDRQRGGVGEALLRAALDDARADGCDCVTLWTHAANELARRLFEAHGFRPTGRTALDDAGEPTLHLLATIGG
jgi:ribosomal protein S18 acetylase RimI-like enzyme